MLNHYITKVNRKNYLLIIITFTITLINNARTIILKFKDALITNYLLTRKSCLPRDPGSQHQTLEIAATTPTSSRLRLPPPQRPLSSPPTATILHSPLGLLCNLLLLLLILLPVVGHRAAHALVHGRNDPCVHGDATVTRCPPHCRPCCPWPSLAHPQVTRGRSLTLRHASLCRPWRDCQRRAEWTCWRARWL